MNKDCTRCIRCYDVSEWGMNAAYSCYIHREYDDVKEFPFAEAPEKCFVPDFWCSEFVDNLPDSWLDNDMPELEAAKRAYYEKYGGRIEQFKFRR